MNLHINKDLLVYHINNVAHALSSKPTMPIYSGIKLAAAGKELVLTATNGEISIQVTIQDDKLMSIDEDGIAVVPGKYFTDAIRAVDAQDINLSLFEDTTLKILAGRSNFSINVLEKENFPLINFQETEDSFVIDADSLKKLIRKTSFATSQQESRPILTGVCLSAKDRTLEAVASDAYRVARKAIEYDRSLPTFKATIPSRSLDELSKVLEDCNEPVNMFIGSKNALFKFKNVLFMSRVIEGTFPSIANLLSLEYKFSVTFKKNELLSAVGRATLLDSNPTSNIKMTIEDGKTVEFASALTEIGAAKEEITPISCNYEGSFTISFTTRLFTEAIRSFDASEITVNIVSELRPFTITSGYDANLIDIISPVKTV